MDFGSSGQETPYLPPCGCICHVDGTTRHVIPCCMVCPMCGGEIAFGSYPAHELQHKDEEDSNGKSS